MSADYQTAPATFGPDVFVQLALVMLNKKATSYLNCREFRSHFGCNSDVVSKIWKWVMSNKTCTLPSSCQPIHLLWALLFMRVYTSEETMGSMCGGVGEKTFRKWTKLFIFEIEKLEPEEVSRYMSL